MEKREQQTLYQVTVLWNGKRIPVGPRIIKPIAETCAAEIRKQIALGREKLWSDPQVVAIVQTIH